MIIGKICIFKVRIFALKLNNNVVVSFLNGDMK